MGHYTKEDIIRLVREEDVQFIRMQFTDIFGQLKNVAVTASQIRRALDGQIMMDGSSIAGFVRVEESDQYLWPDLDTFAILPWRPQYGKVARLICDVHDPDGTAFAGDPRGVLKRVLDRAEALGFTCNVGAELEFFLFQTDEDGRPTTRTSDEAGYFDLGPLDHGEGTRREVCLNLEQMGLVVEASHHEVAAGQHEIDLQYTDALRAADNIMTFKLAVKTLAQKNGLHATFMPKPVSGAAGSGMHVNMSLFREGRNAFYDEADPRRSVPAGLSVHRRAAGACAGLLRRHQPAGEQLQAAGARLRGPLPPGLVHRQPLRPDPHPHAPGKRHPCGAAEPGPRLQSLPGPGGMPRRGAGRDRAAADAAGAPQRQSL